ncbi:hypothetical protein A9X03_27485 [Mycobacterium sp. E1715]|uniref:DUF732 domain-containing protein n=2 Tax=Mycobacterium TaxID=1763 RepID=UPI0008014D2F|nr:DUF732 domain-containing protein [Mycobacterium sp. E3305]OBG49580.1 hypothetical protein A5704_06675 [Mycobacterium sp. E735]OBG68971.1 hypothetical protein A5703_10050 [Mycobacterium sp. E188]OBG74764.1 hypothetical protein A9X05_25490 [Mycobacterium sp. E3298]OBH10750.1 hypothetical protein A9X03_27485 [Mycobacterium sp. E1715]OBH44606.1 hypothetical protein A5691_01490 [Mycobacterium sp. E183]
MKLVLTISSVAVMIGLAAPAYADDTDGAFLASLDAAGFTYTDPGQAIQAAHYVCSAASGGTAIADIATAVQKGDSALSADKAAKFTAIAANAYCPDALSSSSPTTTTASS